MREPLSREKQNAFLDCLLDMGEMLLDCGAEISRVEDTLDRTARAYGVTEANVFVIPSVIIVSIRFPEQQILSGNRRVHSNGSTDFTRLEKLNALSRSCLAEPVEPEELGVLLAKIAADRKPRSTVLAGSMLASWSFAVFFGGTVYDGAAAAAFALLICFLQKRLGETKLNQAAFNLVISLLTGLGVGALTMLVPGLHMDKILIGDIMLLIPGIAMINAVRNMLVGDTVSGVVRLSESLIWAASLACGFMVAMLMLSAVR